MRSTGPMRPIAFGIAGLFAAAVVGSQACSSKSNSSGGPPARVDSGVSPPVPDSGPPYNPIDGSTPSACKGLQPSTATPQTGLPNPPAITLPVGFALEMLAQVPSARQLAPLPNGDLLVSSQNDTLYIVPAAEAPGASGAPLVFAQLPEKPAQGLVFVAATCTIYVATSHDIYAIPYADGQKSAAVGSSIAKVRQGGIPQNSDGDVHTTTSLAFANGVLYAGVGSSCNACNEVDGTRATIQRFAPDGSNQTTKARRFRNAIAMAINPATGTLWAGGAGQDSLPLGHPYEFFDAVTLHDGIADYGWPDCEENHLDYGSGADCSKTVAPLVELPAYSTIIGATFYPAGQTGAHAFPAKYQGSLFVTAHGSWHTTGSGYFSAPRIAFVEMNGDAPKIPVDWNDPTKQWTDFGGGFQLGDGSTRIARPSGIAVGHDGSLFVADDHNGNVYRIRPK